MTEKARKYEKMTPQELKNTFSNFFQRLGYNAHPEGHPITATKNPNYLSFVNCSMTPYINELETNRDNQNYTIHEATIQPSVRLNGLDENNLLASPHWMTSFDMAGVITSVIPMDKVTRQVNTFLTKEIGVDGAKLHYIVDPDNKNNFQSLLNAGVPEDKIHLQRQNNQILVNWDYGVPGFVGTGITICYIEDKSKLENGAPNPDSQFLNIITVDNFNDGEKIKSLINPFIDMGFGMERLLSLLKGETPFELEGRKEIKEAVIRAAKTKFGEDVETNKRILTLSDHIKTAKLLLDEGIRPSRRDNVNRGHLLQKLLRNAILQEYMLHIDLDFIVEQLAGYEKFIKPEVDKFINRVKMVEEHISDIRLSWLLTKGEQKVALRPRFSSLEMIAQFQSYVNDKYKVPPEITIKFLKKIDREVFYLSGFHERYYPYPALDEEEAVASVNVQGISRLMQKNGLKNVVDFGAGKGRHSIAMSKNFDVTAIDFDPASVMVFKEKIERAGITNVNAIVGDGFRLGEFVEPNSQDAVLIFYTSVLASGEREEDKAVLSQIKQVVKSEGIFMWSVTNLEGVKTFWMPGDAIFYKNNREEMIIYTEKRELTTSDRINAHPVAYRVAEPAEYQDGLNNEQLREVEKYRFVVIETEKERLIVYKDEKDGDKLKSAQIISWEEGLLSIQPYTQLEIKNILTELRFKDIQFHRGIKPDDFDQPNNGKEFDIVVTAKNQ